MQVVPFTSDYDQTFTTTLDGQRYVFDCRWNERGQVWTFDLTRDSDQELLVAGVPLLSGQDVLAPYALGIGGIIVTDLSNTGTDPGPDDFGDRCVPVFFTEAELDVLVAAGIPGIVSTAPIAVAAAAAASSISAPLPPSPVTPSTGGTSGTTVISSTTTVINNNVIAQTTIAGGFSDGRPWSDTPGTGTEILAYQFVYNAAANPSATLKLVALLLASGNGTVRAYLGGTFGNLGDTGTPSGTLAGSVAVTAGGGQAAYAISTSTPVPNPGGLIPVKFTVQSSAPGTAISILPTLTGAVV